MGEGQWVGEEQGVGQEVGVRSGGGATGEKNDNS